MPLENINCPQFVDFTSGDVFDINDGADYCFEKGVVGEENIGFGGPGTNSDLDNMFATNLNLKSSNSKELSSSDVKKVLGQTDTAVLSANKAVLDPNSTNNNTTKKEVLTDQIKNIAYNENKENISGATISKVGSALEMMMMKNNNANPSVNSKEPTAQQQTKPKMAVLATHNTSGNHGQQNVSHNTSALAQEKHKRTPSTNSASSKTAAEKPSIVLYKGIRFLPKQFSSYSNSSNDSALGTPSKEKKHAEQKESSSNPSKPVPAAAVSGKLEELIKNRPESLNKDHQPRIMNNSVLAGQHKPSGEATKTKTTLGLGLTRSTPGKSASFKQSSDSSKPPKTQSNIMASFKSNFMKSKPSTPSTKLSTHTSERDLSSSNAIAHLDSTEANKVGNSSKLLSSFHLRKKSETKPVISGGGLLHTELRALRRNEYDQTMKEKEKIAILVKQDLEAEKARKQQEEINRLRTKSQFRFQPIKQYKPIEIKPSEKPLTNPRSPQLITSTNTSHMSSHGSRSRLNLSTSHQPV